MAHNLPHQRTWWRDSSVPWKAKSRKSKFVFGRSTDLPPREGPAAVGDYRPCTVPVGRSACIYPRATQPSLKTAPSHCPVTVSTAHSTSRRLDEGDGLSWADADFQLWLDGQAQVSCVPEAWEVDTRQFVADRRSTARYLHTRDLIWPMLANSTGRTVTA